MEHVRDHGRSHILPWLDAGGPSVTLSPLLRSQRCAERPLTSSQIWRLIATVWSAPSGLPSASSKQAHPGARVSPCVASVRRTCPSLRDSHQPWSVCRDAPLPSTLPGHSPACIFHRAFFLPLRFPEAVSQAVTFLPGSPSGPCESLHCH